MRFPQIIPIYGGFIVLCTYLYKTYEYEAHQTKKKTLEALGIGKKIMSNNWYIQVRQLANADKVFTSGKSVIPSAITDYCIHSVQWN